MFQEFISSGMCEVCWFEEARYSCRLCSRRVCPRHYVVERGICAVCSINLCEICGRALAVDSCLLCGKLVCRQCSRELQPGIRVCGSCFSNIHEYVRRDSRLSYIERYLKKPPRSRA
ncbi:MAG: hypothetical protein RMH84_04430 [Sulfolobales archaeon]|nr:hypothetical protein [Sulfolobales archaeon]MCX8209132.1 hypothetical protein [Sulfolobales archaeon]MDW8010821.1 hypothetical protein [Sulfolobales archaeon]